MFRIERSLVVWAVAISASAACTTANRQTPATAPAREPAPSASPAAVSHRPWRPLHKGGADVILMNMQYSPRTDIMVPLGPYADNMRVVAQQHEIPLFDRLAVMRNWSDTGAFDLYAAGKDNVLAQRVHDCIARGIAFMIIDAAHLHPESKAAQ